MNGTIITFSPSISSRGAIMNATVCRRLLGAAVIAVVVGVSGAASASPAASEQIVLKGLDPQAYMQRRHRQPDVSQELQALPMATVLRVLRDDDAVAFAPADAYATGLKPGVTDAMRVRERQAVKQGALLVLSRSTDPRNAAAIAAAITAAVDDQDPAVAATAAERLGDLRPGPAISVLKSVVVDHDRAVAVRAGACAGLGRARSAEALDILLAVVEGDDDDVVKGAALQAIALLGSRWAWEARHDVDTGAALRARAVQRLSALPLKGDVDARRTAVVQQLLR
jgi:hypothetical protein